MWKDFGGRFSDFLKEKAAIIRALVNKVVALPGLKMSLLMAGFGIALIATAWTALALQIANEHRSMIRTVSQETTNLALVFEQGVNRTASEIDRILKYIRSSYERNGYKADWPNLVMEEFTANKRTVQIAVMARDGMMITSTKMLYPKRPIDLSDREHYRVHAERKTDRLFISKPVLGRASKKWSVQFTRPYMDKAGKFNGVLVVSLDPEFLTRYYSSLDLGKSGGLAVVGKDGLVRAGAGVYKDLLGKPLPQTVGVGKSEKTSIGTMMHVSTDKSQPVFTAAYDDKDFPLRAIITRSDTPQFAAWYAKRNKYLIGGLLFTVLVACALIASIIWRQRYERQLNYLAHNDSLTGLPNRMEFGYRSSAIHKDKWKRNQYSVLMVDLDDFKGVNDRYGHPVGDALLVEAARRLQRTLRECDTVARLGGDEFAILHMNCLDVSASEALASRICAELAVPYEVKGIRIECGASVGIAGDFSKFDDDDHIMRSADLALYTVKREGRGTYRVFEERMEEEAKNRSEIEAGLREALNEDGLEIHYQPIVDMKTREMSGVEALLRWRHPEKGFISPGEFIPVAEQSGLIVDIGKFVISNACETIARRSDDLMVAVNVSAVEFRDSNVARSVKDALRNSGLSPARLKVEITESLLMRHDDPTLAQLAEIRQMGVTIAMDDFGTGYSSLSYLHTYPIDCIKIDQAFVRSLNELDQSQAIVQTIATLAQNMNMQTVAEGIETEEQYKVLLDAGCDCAQGYLFGRPVPIDELLGEEEQAESENEVAAAVA